MALPSHDTASSPSDSSVLEEPQTKPRETVRRRRRELAITVVVLAIVALFTTAAGLHDFRAETATSVDDKVATQTYHREPEECGQSADDARELGCVFDAVLMGWVPWRCHDKALSADFLRHNKWQLHEDANLTAGTAVSEDEVMSGRWAELYADYDFLVFSCMYAWKKTRRATLSGVVLDGYTADEHNTNHCQMNLLSDPRPTANTVYVKYVSCPWVNIDRGRFGWYRMIGGKKVSRQP